MLSETKNPLSESLGGYENISILHALEAPSIEFLRMVKDEITAGMVESIIPHCSFQGFVVISMTNLHSFVQFVLAINNILAGKTDVLP